MIPLPEVGYVRKPQLIGRPAVSPEEARSNKERAKLVREQNPITADDPTQRRQQELVLARKLAQVGPKTPRPAIPGVLPWSKSKLYDAISKGQFPAPVKLSARISGWPVDVVRQKLAELATGV